MEEFQQSEIEEISPEEWVQYEYLRRWPKYLIEWSIRQRVGDSDIPVAQGSVEHVPQPGETPEQIWELLKPQAQQAAIAASQQGKEEAPKRRSFLSRLFGGK